MVVGSEKESLILENNLIKKYDPKYNILLRDDKSYPYIELTNDEYPRLSIVRSLNKKGNGNLYGPYPNVTAARNTVNLLNRMYPLRKCTTFNKKPCLYYHIKECLGYCTNQVDSNEMEQMRKEIVTFLKGDYEIITKKIEKEMLEQSEKMNYEKALELKELSDYIKVTLAKQKVEIREQIDIDIFGYYVNKGYLSIQIFFIRGGKIVERHSKIIPLIDEVDAELTRYIVDVYQNNFLLPKEILVPDIVDAELISNYYSISCRVPIRGEKLRLIEMANKNAKITLDNEFELLEKDENRTYVANQELKQILNLDRLERIELFDNSHLFGTYSVSGMVVFIDGKPAKNEYRKYKIKVDTNDEYGMMREVIYRRYFRVLKDQLTKPDLIIVDGGIGQIHIAREVIESLGLHIPVVGLKKDDHHTTDSLLGFNPIQTIKIDKKSNLFYFLERMQDEVHNFTIHYHQQIRSKGTLSSVLDTVEGIGSVRKKELLKKYKTLSKMKEAPLDELKQILPEAVAINLQDFLKNY